MLSLNEGMRSSGLGTLHFAYKELIQRSRSLDETQSVKMHFSYKELIRGDKNITRAHCSYVAFCL